MASTHLLCESHVSPGGLVVCREGAVRTGAVQAAGVRLHIALPLHRGLSYRSTHKPNFKNDIYAYWALQIKGICDICLMVTVLPSVLFS